MDGMDIPQIKTIMRAINEVPGTPDFETLMRHVEKVTRASRFDIVEVITFLKELPQQQATTNFADIDPKKQLSLTEEVSYNYQVAKELLKHTLSADKVDGEEVRKTLREVNRFIDSMLKTQEKLYNLDTMQRFIENVVDMIAEHPQREEVMRKLLGT